MKKALKQIPNIIYILLLLFPIILSLLCYNNFPDNVAIHWNSQGIADNFVSRNMAAFGLPIIELVIVLIFNISRKNNYTNNKNFIYYIGTWGIAIIPAIVQITIVSMIKNVNVNMNINIGIIFTLLFGIIMIIIGALIPHSKIDFYKINAKSQNIKKRPILLIISLLWIVCGLLLCLSTLFVDVLRNYLLLDLIIIILIAIIPRIIVKFGQK